MGTRLQPWGFAAPLAVATRRVTVGVAMAVADGVAAGGGRQGHSGKKVAAVWPAEPRHRGREMRPCLPTTLVDRMEEPRLSSPNICKK